MPLFRRTMEAVFLFLCAVGDLRGDIAVAQSDVPQAAVAPGSPAPTLRRSGHKTKPAKTAAKPPARTPEPWEVVDPGRAGREGASDPSGPGADAVPGVQHIVRPDEDRFSYGMKWNSSNAPNTVDSSQGVLNEINHDLGAPNQVGTDAEAGVKLKF